jgi:hypothetical protein
MVEQELAESLKRLAEQELKRTELEEFNRRLTIELEESKKDSQEEVEELRRKFEIESRVKYAIYLFLMNRHDLIWNLQKEICMIRLRN